MYRLSRFFLRLAVLLGFYCLIPLTLITWPASAVIIGTLLLFRLIRGGKRFLTTLGSARWASARELDKAGMIDAPSGLIVGRLPDDGRVS